ncbi:MAG: STAS domain-containing protein [bacterium]
MELKIETKTEEGRAVMTIHGEIDMYNAPNLKEKALSVIEDLKGGLLVVDLGDVEYIDSTGLGILIGFRRRMIEGGGTLRLVMRSPRMEKLFEITGLRKVFEIYGDAAEAESKAAGGK